ncbi:MAG: MotA/TolQ/ExbB proton channel family protein [Magnetospirillum sp. WYHS-4]
MMDGDAVAEKPRQNLDLATVLGLVGGFVLIFIAIAMGGSPKAFFDLPSVLIVIGGTFTIVLTCFSVGEVMRTFRVVLKTVFHGIDDSSEAAIRVLQLAETARKQGVLALQPLLSTLTEEAFLHKGIAMVVDGTPGEEVEAILRRDILATQQRHAKSAGVLKKAAEFAPAMGLIGTLIGLIQMLGNLSNPSSIGPAMAVALITTFYGAILANMVFAPLAAKLERNSQEETLVTSVYMMGAASIGRQENPRRLEMLLNSVLPPAKRVQYFD